MSTNLDLTPIELERRHISQGMARLHKIAGNGCWEVEASGAWITLSDGRRLLDLGSYGTTLLGHRHPLVVGRVRCQLDAMPTSSRSLTNATTAAYAATLSEAIGLPWVWLASNGTDVVEAALKLARAATNRPRIVAAQNGYHGKSLGSLSVTWAHRYRDPFRAVLGPVTHVRADDILGLRRELSRGDVAAVIVEPIQGDGGVDIAPLEHLRSWSEEADGFGAHFIVDEIQTGFFRCGSLSLAAAAGVPMSAILLGKSLGGGVMPLSAIVMNDSLIQPLRRDPFLHTVTFGGHPLAAAAGLGAFEAVAAIGTARRVELASSVERILRAAATDFPRIVGSVRGLGLLWGLESTTPEAAGTLLMELSLAGIVVSPCLGRPEVIRLFVPAVATDCDLEQFECRFRAALSATDSAISSLDGAIP